jgi:hypothetical protein
MQFFCFFYEYMLGKILVLKKKIFFIFLWEEINLKNLRFVFILFLIIFRKFQRKPVILILDSYLIV